MKSYKGAVFHGSSSGAMEGPQHFETMRGSWRRGSGRRGRGRYQYRGWNQSGFGYPMNRRGGGRMAHRMNGPYLEEEIDAFNPRASKGKQREDQIMDATMLMLEAFKQKGKAIKMSEMEDDGDEDLLDETEQETGNGLRQEERNPLMEGMDDDIDKVDEKKGLKQDNGNGDPSMKPQDLILINEEALKTGKQKGMVNGSEEAMEDLNLEERKEEKKQGVRKKLAIQNAMVLGKASRRIMKTITSPRKGTAGRTRSKENKKEEGENSGGSMRSNAEMEISDTNSAT